MVDTVNDWAVAHDFAYTFGGAERVTKDLIGSIASSQPLYYLAGSPDVLKRVSGNYEAILQFNPSASTHRALSPIYAELMRARKPLDVNLIASSYAFCHQLRSTGATVVYCHSPLRQVWSGKNIYSNSGPLQESLAVKLFGGKLRHQDRRAANRASGYIATSTAVADRIMNFYGITPDAIVAPAYDDAVYSFAQAGESDYYLWVGRITEPYKRLGLVIDYFNGHPDKNLIVVGDGRDRKFLEGIAAKNIQFTGWKDPDALSGLYSNARALIFPSEDDFGITAVEAMACGLPVIAFNAGGARDTVTSGYSGVFFDSPTTNDLGCAIDRFEKTKWNRKNIAESALQKYGSMRFSLQIKDVLSRVKSR